MTAEVRELARRLVGRGYHVTPLDFGTKRCAISHWTSVLIGPDDVDKFFPEGGSYGIGLMTGTEVSDGVYPVAIDVDVEDPILIQRIRCMFPVGVSLSAKRGRKGITFFCRSKDSFKKVNVRVKGETKSRVEVLSKGMQTVLPPSLHPETNSEYEWVEGESLEYIDPDQLPLLTDGMRDEIMLAVLKPDNPLFDINTMVWLGPSGGGSVHESVLRAVGVMIQRHWTNEDVSHRIRAAVSRMLANCPFASQWDGRQFDIDLDAMIRGARDKGFDKSGPKKMSRQERMLQAAFDYIDTLGGNDNIANFKGTFRIYANGWWRETSREQLARAIKAMPDVRAWAMASDAYAVADTVMLDAAEWRGTTHDMVATSLYTVDLRTGEHVPHDRSHGLTYCLPFEYDPSAACPTYDRFVDDVFRHIDPETGEPVSDDDHRMSVELFDEFAGLTFVDDTSFQKALVIEGPPAGGKSVLLYVVEQLHSAASQTAVDLFDLRDERTVTSLAGKLVSFTPEISPDDFVPADMFKKIADGSSVPTRRLYAEKVDITMTARMMIACNEMFRYRDASGAMERRMLLLKSRPTIPDDEQDLNLKPKLLQERQGIFARWVRALMRLRQRGRFSAPTYMRRARDASYEGSNPVITWVRDHTHEGLRMDDPDYSFKANGGTESVQLFKAFSEWYKEMGYRPMSVVTWGTRMTQMGYPAKMTRVGKRVIRVRDLHLLLPHGAAEGKW